MFKSYEYKKAINEREKALGLYNNSSIYTEDVKFLKTYPSEGNLGVKLLKNIYGEKADYKCDCFHLYIDKSLNMYACFFLNDNDISGEIWLEKIRNNKSLENCFNIMEVIE